jgi:ech hydrogenase subunit D
MGEQTIKVILPGELLSETLHMKNKGYRLAAISCTNKNGMEISYSFDKNYDLLSLRFNINSDVEIQSISSIYPYSFLYENEIKELFGVKIQHISIDFDNNLYRIAAKTPFNTEKEIK